MSYSEHPRNGPSKLSPHAAWHEAFDRERSVGGPSRPMIGLRSQSGGGYGLSRLSFVSPVASASCTGNPRYQLRPRRPEDFRVVLKMDSVGIQDITIRHLHSCSPALLSPNAKFA